jgi:predicted acetyltransferase
MFQFLALDLLTDGEIDLKIHKKVPANEEKGYVPAYHYQITLHDSFEVIGEIDLRVGYTEGLYYGGHIGYHIFEPYRGHHYAYKACLIIKRVAVQHGMKELIITCSPDNLPSRKTLEKLGLHLKEIAKLPPYNDMYQLGEREKCIFVWNL